MSKKVAGILKSIGVIFLLLTFSSLFLIMFKINPQTVSEKSYLIYYTFSNLILTIIFILIYKKDLIKDFKKYRSKTFNTSLKYWIVGFMIMLISNLIITYVLKLDPTSNEEKVRNYINISSLLMILNTCIFAPITEELAFRKSIKDAINNKWIYVLVSGLLFGLVHVISLIQSPIYLIHIMFHL